MDYVVSRVSFEVDIYSSSQEICFLESDGSLTYL
jgi:hypothetical protein